MRSLQAVNRVVVVPVRGVPGLMKSPGATVLEILFPPPREGGGRTRHGTGVSTKLVHAQLFMSPGSGEFPASAEPKRELL